MKDLANSYAVTNKTKSPPENAARLEAKDISWRVPRGGKLILSPVSFDLAPGNVLGIVGPNGAGKSTLLRLLYRYLRPETGSVRVDGVDIWSVSARSAARKIAAVLQEQPTDFALTVREIVALGRTPHRTGFAGMAGARDAKIVTSTLDRLHLGQFADRHLGTLSGGERQRVMVARALAQEPSLLILDEPTNHLDIRHQLEILALIKDLPLTIVTSLHDLNMAGQVCDDVLLLKNGHPLGFGSPNTVFTESTVSKAFGVKAELERLTPSETNHMTFHL
jgi:iron complex transport system ATP-binding protein